MQHEEMFDEVNAIFKFVYENPNIHRKILRKKLLQKGRVSSKGKYSSLLDVLISSGKLILDKELVSINPKLVKPAIFQKKDDEAFVVTAGSKKRYKVDKSVASGFKSGDLLEVVVDTSGKVMILGKSQRTLGETKNVLEQTGRSASFIKDNLVLGRVVKLSHDDLVFIPNKKSFAIRQIPILNNKDASVNFQDKICVMKLINYEAPILGGFIVEVKGEAGNPIHEYDAIAESYGAIMNWDDYLIDEELEKIPTRVDETKLKLMSEDEAQIFHKGGHTVDLRHLPFTTVDPATCKDMDDAIYSTFDENGDLVCYTAVANVTKYVKPNSEIFNRYVKGGFTIYAPNKAYNILPSKLSTGICSLNPNEDRLAFVVKTVIDKSCGKVKSSNIYDAIIKSRKKYSYEQAQEIVDQNKDVVLKTYLQGKCMAGEPLTEDEQVLMNYYAGQTIKVGFEQRKMIRFVSNDEREVKFDDDLQDVVDIIPVDHLYYHEVIEAFMITANEATAKYAKDNNLDNIFRVHDAPNPRKLERANEFFELLGVDFDGELSAEGTRSLIELIQGTASEEVVNKFLIKMQSRAVYSNHLYNKKQEKATPEWYGDKISHYALQSPHYSHTTSPIRRVPDYVTQFNILAHIHNTQSIPAKVVQKIVEIANDRQLDIDQAEKDFDDISSVMYAEKHIGEKMSGRISKIRNTMPEEGYEDDIVVIVKNETKGICVEIPLSQVLGRPAFDCELSKERCAVYDARGNVVLTLCKPLDFIIEKADRKTMTIVGRTNREFVHNSEQGGGRNWSNHSNKQRVGVSNHHSKQKNHRSERFESKKDHKKQEYGHHDEFEE